MKSFVEMFQELESAILNNDVPTIVDIQSQARAMGVTGRLSANESHALATLNRSNLLTVKRTLGL